MTSVNALGAVEAYKEGAVAAGLWGGMEMGGLFSEKMADPEVRKDTRLLGDFCGIYCRGRHAGRARAAMTSPAADLGVYRRTPVLCEECAEVLRYAEQRRAFCLKDPKPFCSHCDTHCYRPDMRERVQEVMRYAGPRSMLHGHAVDGIRHLIEGSMTKKAAAVHDTKES